MLGEEALNQVFLHPQIKMSRSPNAVEVLMAFLNKAALGE